MNVQELIDKLNTFEDKTMEVKRNDSEWGPEHIDQGDVRIVKDHVRGGIVVQI